MGYQAKKIRNAALVGHGGDGKTTLTEAILFSMGAVDRQGRVEDGTTVSDSDPEEIRRRISISASLVPVEYKGCKINLLDCPGYFDFAGEEYGALSVCEMAVIVMSAVSGVQVGTEKALALTKKRAMARMVFVNQMDRENADFAKALAELEQAYGSAIAPLQYPIMRREQYAGYVDILQNKAYLYGNGSRREIERPAELEREIEDARTRLAEAAAENDEELLEKYFGGEELTPEELVRGLMEGVRSGMTVPVLCGSAVSLQGVSILLDSILAFAPAPEGTAKAGADASGAGVSRLCADSEPFSAQVFKTVTDPFVGKLSFFKVYSGVLEASTALYNPNAGKSEKLGALYTMKGKKQIPVSALHAGDIGAVSKLQHTLTSHTLCSENAVIQYPPIEMPEPALTLSVYPQVKGEEDKVFSGFRRLEEEDPTFRISKNEETNEMQVSGVGEMQLDVLSKKLKNKFNVSVRITDPKIPYREAIRKSVKAEGKHKKQSGGHGQYGHCWVEFEPIRDSENDFEFVDHIVGGVVPRAYIPAVEKGLRECIQKGVLAGYPVVGLRCTLYDGSYHDVDSSEMAFKIAASLAFKKACREADPVLLEPVYHVEVVVPDEYMGDVIGDLNKRRGRVLGMEPSEEGQLLIAEAPLAEMFKYATDLRSMTQARGSFRMRFERYEETPPDIMKKIVAQAQAEE